MAITVLVGNMWHASCQRAVHVRLSWTQLPNLLFLVKYSQILLHVSISIPLTPTTQERDVALW